ncbi:MAG: alpha/beta hydrolase [Bacteroidales bacterium]|nr:alpha/beta hydrolase [Bacteroidales bacterium]
MKNYFFSLLLLVCSFSFGSATAYAQQAIPSSFNGRWWLAVLEEASLPINLTFSKDSPLLYSPMQTKDPLSVSKWSFSNDTLRISSKSLGLRMTLVWNDSNGTFSGIFRQGLLSAELRFGPADSMFSINRPQMPMPPFPYSEEEVTIKRSKEDVTLKGTLTMPEGKGPFPAVVLVSGSGQQNRDEELLGHKPFLVLADYLSRNGIAVLRYDDRGVGGSKGDFESATTLDFADDAEAVFNFIRKQKGIDSKRVGLVGHSEGGQIASIVAARNRKVAFIVLLAGPGTSGAEILLQQNERIFQLDSVPQQLIEKRLEVMRAFFDATDTLPVDKYQSFLISLIEYECKDLDASQRKIVGLRRGDAISFAAQMRIPWMRTFIKLDNSEYLAKIRCPVFAINGDKDCQVLPCNLDSINNATSSKAMTFLMPGLNHLMQHCYSGAAREYMFIEETMAKEVLDLIVRCISDYL